MKSFFAFIWEAFKVTIIAVVIVVPIRYFLFQPFLVKGQSMEPNFESGDYLIVDEISYRFREPQRGEVIVFKYPNDASQRYIKRIIGLPEETITISNGKISISGKNGEMILDESEYLPEIFTPGDTHIALSENEYFVLGDNRIASSDSRSWGTLPEDDIIGRTFLRAWPFDDFTKITAPEYSR